LSDGYDLSPYQTKQCIKYLSSFWYTLGYSNITFHTQFSPKKWKRWRTMTCWATMISQGSLILWKLQLEFNKEIELLAMMELRLLTGNVCSTANATFYIPVWNASSHSKFIMSITYHLSTIILLDCFLLVSHKHLWSSKPSIITSMIWRTKHHQKQALDLQVCKLSYG